MNIFVLDKDPRLAAAYHNDRHVCKMILESAQILSTAHVIVDGEVTARERVPLILRPTHMNHPCVRWASVNTANYSWLLQLMGHLLVQYTERYGKEHSYGDVHEDLQRMPERLMPSQLTTTRPQCMPEQYRLRDEEVVTAYRGYYFGEKQHLASWKVNGPPVWWSNMSWHAERELV